MTAALRSAFNVTAAKSAVNAANDLQFPSDRADATQAVSYGCAYGGRRRPELDRCRTAVGSLPAHAFPGQILMPVSEELRQIKLGDLVEYLGLVPVRTPLPGRATPPTDAEV
jgi:hypothetical protein